MNKEAMSSEGKIALLRRPTVMLKPTNQQPLPANRGLALTALGPAKEQLAALPAQSLSACGNDPAQAAAKAMQVWDASVAKAAARSKRIEQERAKAAFWRALRLEAGTINPKPAVSFAQMLKRIMPGLTSARRVDCLQSYLKHLEL